MENTYTKRNRRPEEQNQKKTKKEQLLEMNIYEPP